MDLTVSCLLEGRDLAVVKSLININNIYGNLNLAYVEGARSGQILIAKDQIDSGVLYYAVNRQSGTKYLIEPELNPQTVRDLFETLAHEVNGHQQVKESEKPTEIITFPQFIDQQSHTESLQNLWIYLEDISIIMAGPEQRVFATKDITEDVLLSFCHLNICEMKFKHSNDQIPEKYGYSTAIEPFKWNLGYCLTNKLLHEKHKSSDYWFKQISWPDYGTHKFRSEFIKLSSLISKKPGTYENLLSVTGFDEDVIIQFLNASIMSGHVLVTSEGKPITRKVKHNSSFLSSLKKIFLFK